MNPNFQNRRMPPNNRNRGGQARFGDNRKPQGLMDSKMKKPEKMETQEMNKSMKDQEKPSPKGKPDHSNKREPPSPSQNQQNRQNQQHHHHQNNQNNQKDLNKTNDGSNEEQGESAPKKFTGRCRLFVGNLPNDTTEEQFRALFTPYGELSEVFVNPSRGFGFVRLDTRQNAEAAKAALDGVQKKNRVLRVRFATHGAALRIKFLPAHVSNELLEEAFSNFGPVERAVVIVDDRGKPTGDAIVEFARKPAAQQALGKINDGAFLLGASPRPVLAEPLEQKDEEDGYPEKFIMKNVQFHKEREQGPRFAPPGSFEFEMAQKWKEVYRMEADHKVQLQREMDQAIARLELEQEQAIHEHQAMLLRQDLMRRQEELRKLEERQMEMAKRMEMKRQEDDMRRQEEERRRQEMMMRQQQEQEMRRRQMENRSNRGGPSGPSGPADDFEMRGGGNRSMDRGTPGRSSFSEMRGGRGMENRGRGDFNESQGEMAGNMGQGAGNMGGSGGGGGMRRGNEGGGGGRAPPMQPPPAPPAALGLDRQRQGGMGGGNQGGMGGGNQGGMGGGNQGGMGGGGGGGGGGNNMRQSRFDQSSGNQGGFGGNNMGPGGNMGGSGSMGGSGGNMGQGSMGGRGPMGGNNGGGGGMNRRREGGPREDYFENKRPRF